MNKKIPLILSYITTIILTYYILKFNIANNIRLIIIIITILTNIYFTYTYKKQSKVNKILLILFIIINLILTIILNITYSYLKNLNKITTTYSISLYSKNNTGITSLNDCINLKIGVLKIDNDNQNTIIDKLINENNLNNNEIIDYNDIAELINDLDIGNINLMIIPKNLIDILETENNYIEIINKEEIKQEYSTSTGKDLKSSFTLLIMGVDSTVDGNINASSNGDTLIVISFNPKTLNATMLSIPRDSYVPITCFKNQRENKITHSAWYGEKCVESTIEKLLDIEIDYYVKINFKGVVSIVNELGGVYVDVPRDLCTDNSNREDKTCIKKGYQLLNGEQALTLARNRYDLPNGDFDRMKNQQLLLTSLMSSLKNIDSISKVKNILDTVSSNMETNMNINEIISLYDIYQDINKLSIYNKTPIKITKLALFGKQQTIYDEISKINHWNYILSNESIKDVSNAIKNNLNQDNLIRNFNFDIAKKYEDKIIGENGNYSVTLYNLLPNLIGKTKEEVENYANKYNINLEIEIKEDNNNSSRNNTVIYQNYHEKTRIDRIDTLKITILKKDNKLDNIEEQEQKEKLPSLIGKSKEESIKILNNLNIKYKINEVNALLYPGIKINTVVSQSIKENTDINEIKEIEITIVTD